MTTRIVVATHNRSKMREIARLLVPWEVEAEPTSLDLPEETGSTFAENARLKAISVWSQLGGWVLADDSGLCVDALDGGPGVRSARWVEGSDADRMHHLLRRMEQIPDSSRLAYFSCTVVLVTPTGRVHETEGRCEGRICRVPRGEHGFGYDPIFEVLADPSRRTMAELPDEEKDRLGHRGRALFDLQGRMWTAGHDFGCTAARASANTRGGSGRSAAW